MFQLVSTASRSIAVHRWEESVSASFVSSSQAVVDNSKVFPWLSPLRIIVLIIKIKD